MRFLCFVRRNAILSHWNLTLPEEQDVYTQQDKNERKVVSWCIFIDTLRGVLCAKTIVLMQVCSEHQIRFFSSVMILQLQPILKWSSFVFFLLLNRAFVWFQNKGLFPWTRWVFFFNKIPRTWNLTVVESHFLQMWVCSVLARFPPVVFERYLIWTKIPEGSQYLSVQFKLNFSQHSRDHCEPHNGEGCLMPYKVCLHRGEIQMTQTCARKAKWNHCSDCLHERKLYVVYSCCCVLRRKNLPEDLCGGPGRWNKPRVKDPNMSPRQRAWGICDIKDKGLTRSWRHGRAKRILGPPGLKFQGEKSKNFAQRLSGASWKRSNVHVTVFIE